MLGKAKKISQFLITWRNLNESVSLSPGFYKSFCNDCQIIPWFPQSLAISQLFPGVDVSAGPGGPVPSKASGGGDCCGLLRLPLPSEIDELIVELLPVCLCPGWRCPGYGWESQLWHLPWGYYCGRPAGGPGGRWPREQLWPTYCCHTPGDTAALSPTWTSDWLRQSLAKMTPCGVEQLHSQTARPCQTSVDDSS